MAVSIKLRLYDFPSKAVTGLQSIVCKDMDIDGKFLFEQIADLLKVSSSQLCKLLVLSVVKQWFSTFYGL